MIQALELLCGEKARLGAKWYWAKPVAIAIIELCLSEGIS